MGWRPACYIGHDGTPEELLDLVINITRDGDMIAVSIVTS